MVVWFVEGTVWLDIMLLAEKLPARDGEEAS